MKSLFPILFCLAIPVTAIGEQSGEDAALENKVQQAILEFNKRKEDTAKEPAKEVEKEE